MPFQIIRSDITKVRADAIVNTANPKPRIGRGTDSAIYAAAGEEQLLKAREQIGEIAPGQAVYTDAFNLNARYIIHTVGPMWIDGEHGEREILHSCYENSLALAAELSCKSIAFPLIASGTYGFPKDEALHIALTEIQKFLLTHEMKIILVVFDRKALELSEGLIGGIEQYIDDYAVRELRERERGQKGISDHRRRRLQREEQMVLESIAYVPEPYEQTTDGAPPPIAMGTLIPDISGKSLDEVLGNAGESFQQRLLELIDKSGMDDVTVYKKANIDRKVFSRIRCKPDYKPKKKTAVAFAIALELDLPTMTDLLSRAEIALSPNNRFDLIITYFVSNKIYDIYEINAALFKYGQPILGE